MFGSNQIYHFEYYELKIEEKKLTETRSKFAAWSKRIDVSYSWSNCEKDAEIEGFTVFLSIAVRDFFTVSIYKSGLWLQ